MAENTVEISPGRRIYVSYSKHQTASNTIFFVHGLGGRADQWRHQEQYYKEKMNVCVFSFLGHAGSERPMVWDQYAFSDFVNELKAIYTKYKTEDNIIVAHSYGTAITVQMLCEFKKDELDHIKGVVLLGSYLEKRVLNMIEYLFWQLPAFILERIRSLVSKKFSDAAFHAETSRELVEKEATISSQNPMYIIQAIIAQRDVPKKEDIESAFVDLPVLFLCGESDGLTPVEGSKQTASWFPQSTLVVISKSSHNLMLEKPDEINNNIDKFIKKNLQE
mmetsp:Transcript_2448/g.2734  ORF Transcript_2448/g.2734 Transcript_2448/m.2734 type:complete len:277 (-) Transcript_2448:23-853(-)